MDNVWESDEETDGGYIPLNNSDDPGGEDDFGILTLKRVWPENVSGTVYLTLESGASKICLRDENGNTVTLPQSYSALPKTFTVEGIETSGSLRNIEIKAAFTAVTFGVRSLHLT